MGNDQKPKGPPVVMPTPAEIKTFIMITQTKLNLFRNKKLDIIKKKKLEIAKSLKENNLDVAKAKMDSLIREEDYITAYDILGPLLEILKERVTYIISNNECPPDLRAQLDSVIYASTRLEFEELFKLRDLILRKYGSAYIQKAENNVDKLVNINLVEKLKIKPASDAFLIIRLKQLCKEKKIPFEFPSEITSDIPGDIGNPFGPGNNPYGGDFNPYASVQGNQFGPPQGGNPYGPPQGPPQGGNPYGPPPGDNPFNPPQGGDNPFGPPQGGNNPYGSQAHHQVVIHMVLSKAHHQVVIHMVLSKAHHQVVIHMVLSKAHHQVAILMALNKAHHKQVIHLIILKMIIILSINHKVAIIILSVLLETANLVQSKIIIIVILMVQ